MSVVALAISGWKRSALGLWSRLWLWSKLGIGVKMTLIVIAGTIALVALFAYMGTTALNANIQRSLQERVVVAQVTARHLDYVLADVENVLTQAARQDGLLNPARRADALAALFPRASFFAREVLIVDAAGAVTAAYPSSPQALSSLAGAAAVRQALEGKSFAISRGAAPGGNGRITTLAAVPLYGAGASPVAALVLAIDLTSPNLQVFTDSVGLAGSGYLDLVDADGVILASTRAYRTGERSDHDTILADRIETGSGSFVARCHDCPAAPAPADARPEMLAFAPLVRAPWGVTVRQDEQEILGTAADLETKIYGMGAVALVGALLLVYLTTRSVIVPVQALTAATQRIAAGDLGTPIRDSGQDEIGLLARSFDTMRARLKALIGEIQAWNRELDARVQERTAALAAAKSEAQETRDQLRTIIDSLGDDLMVIDREYRVTRVNAALRRHCAPGSAIQGARCWQVAHAGRACQSPDCECPVPRVLETGKPFRVTHEHRDGDDGRIEFVQVTASPLFAADGSVSGAVELWRDVTDERQLEEVILQRNHELSAVNAIARIVGRSLKLDECLQVALAEVRRITQMEVGSIFLTEGAECALKLHACYGISEQGAEATGRLALSDTACGGVLQLGEAVVVQDVPHGARGGAYGVLQRESLLSLIHVPLVAKGTPRGTLCLGGRTRRTFTQEEISLLTAIGSQIAVAVENARLYEELMRKEQLRGELLRRILSVQEEERKRIARELHDETSQTLAALLYALDGAETTCPGDTTRPHLERMRRLTVGAIDGVHRMIFDLRPTMLDQLGLVSALRWYAETRLAESETRVHVTEQGQVRRLPSVLETALFRTVQEAINNVARHAGARHLQITSSFAEDGIEIRIEDDGIGFDASDVGVSPDSLAGLGLMSMQERMSAVGGACFVDSVPTQGTVIVLQAPIPGGGNGTDPSAHRG